MRYAYDRKKPLQDAPRKAERYAPEPSLNALRAGSAQPTREQMGHRVDLPEAMRSKMESAFGADLSAVRLYESQAVADAGAQAVTQGNQIAFAPGMLDFSSFGGQALLGHEISHVVSQARGEVKGGGFLNDHALEARADREGAMAAAGQQIAAPTAALSSVTAASASGPMQAKKPWKRDTPAPAPAGPAYERFSNVPEIDPMSITEEPNRAVVIGSTNGMGRGDHRTGNHDRYVPESVRPGRDALVQRIETTLSGPEYGGLDYNNVVPHNSDSSVKMTGSGGVRMLRDLYGSPTMDMSDDEITGLFTDL